MALGSVSKMSELGGNNILDRIIPDLQPGEYFFARLFGYILLFALISAVAVFIKYVSMRERYSSTVPGLKTFALNVLGNFSACPSKRNRNGYTIPVFALQTINGHANVFKRESMFCMWVSYVPVVFVHKAESVEELISGTKNMEKGWNYQMLHPWLGTGLLTSHGSKWKSRRKLLTPAFHFEILKDFLPVINEQSQFLVKLFEKETKERWTDITLPIILCSLDIICETTLGISIKAQKNRDSEYVQAVGRTSETLIKRMVNPKYWHDFIFYVTKVGKQFKKDIKLLHDFTISVIQEKKKRILSGETNIGDRKRKALMDLLLEHHINNQDLSDEDIREEVDTFTFEGHDTTSMGICWTLYLIGLHRDVQAKVHEELDTIFGDDVERSVSTDDIKDMEYLDKVLKESQRLYPSVPAFMRTTSEDITIGGYKVPKGITCTVMTYTLHRDENVFPDPEKFDPERFSAENSTERHPYAYIPFSAGPRNCIGQRFAAMELKVVISNILRSYTLESLDPRDKVVPSPDLILRPTGPLRLKIRRRY